MKKKLMALLALCVAVSPLAQVKAAEIVYKEGELYNFIVNKDQYDAHEAGNDNVGLYVRYLGEHPTDKTYIRAMAAQVNFSDQAFCASADDCTWENSIARTNTVNHLTGGKTEEKINSSITYSEELPFVKDYTKSENLELIGKEEFLKLFAAEPNDDKTVYTLTADGVKKFDTVFNEALDGLQKNQMAFDLATTGSKKTVKGFFTGTIENGKVWVINPLFDEEGATKSVTVEMIDVTDNGSTEQEKFLYGCAPILYFNKTFNCRYQAPTETKQYSCYKCDDQYQWLVVGSQKDTCQPVPDATTKNKCVDSPKTGVKDYILEFTVAAGVCLIVVVALKRKSLFNRI